MENKNYFSKLISFLFIFSIQATLYGQITGTVYTDYNRNGVMDAGEDGTNGIVGLGITAYDSTGASSATVTSANGVYTISTAGLTGPEIRVELDNIPTGYNRTFSCNSNEPSVQFVDIGSTDINFGLLPQPAVSFGEEGQLFTTCFVNGDRTLSSNADVLIGISGTNAPIDRAYPYDLGVGLDHLGFAGGYGAIWGIAVDEWTGIVYTSAFLKRHTDLGPQGIAGLYWGTYSAGSLASTGSVDLNTLSANSFGADPRNDGVGPDDNLSGVAPDRESRDRDAFELVGKRGIGDIDLSPDGKTLYVMNLTDRVVEAFDVSSVATGGSPAYIGAYNITDPGCSTEWRPFALKVLDAENIYVGIVCSGENVANEDLNGNGNDVLNGILDAGEDANGNGLLDGAHDVLAFVEKIDISAGLPGTASTVSISNFTPSNPAGLPAPPADAIPLYYTRSCYASFTDLANGRCPNERTVFSNWTDTWPDTKVTNSVNTIYYATPILSDIEIAKDGGLILGFMDRTGHQVGARNYSTNIPDDSFYSAVSGGEIIKVCNTSGDPSNLSFALEGSGACSGNTSVNSNPLSPASALGIGAVGEFYDDSAEDPGDASGGGYLVFEDNNHHETFYGGLAYDPNRDELIISAMDPDRTFDAGGLVWLKNSTGEFLDGRTLYNSSFADGTPATFAKGNGIGDVEYVGRQAIELGNRVWSDKNANGIQDPGEPAISNTVVTLHDMNDGARRVGTATTDSEGYYCFGGNDNTNLIRVDSVTVIDTFYIYLSDNDVYEANGLVPNDVATYFFASYFTGLRFFDVTIPQNADILSADLTVRSDNNDPNNGQLTTNISAENVGNSSYLPNAPLLSSRPLTTQNTSWTMPTFSASSYYTSPDISNVLQEVVDRADWDKGNALSLIMTSTGGGYRAIEDQWDNFLDPTAYIAVEYRFQDTICYPYLALDKDYEIRIDNTQNPLLSSLTTTDASLGTNPDWIDSDPTLTGNNATIAYRTSAVPEENDHTLDFGFLAEIPILTDLTDETLCVGDAPTNVTTSITNNFSVTYQWYDDNGTDNPGTAAISGQTTATLTAIPTVAGSYSYRVLATSTEDPACFASTSVNLIVEDCCPPVRCISEFGEYTIIKRRP